MAMNASIEQDTLTRRVKTSLKKAEGTAANLRKNNVRLLVAGIFSSAAATLVAGVTAALGPIAGQGDAGWRAACIVAAVFGFISTTSIGLNQQLRFSQRLSKGRQCVGRLRSLEMMLETGRRSRKEAAQEFTEIVKSYPEFVN